MSLSCEVKLCYVLSIIQIGSSSSISFILASKSNLLWPSTSHPYLLHQWPPHLKTMLICAIQICHHYHPISPDFQFHFHLNNIVNTISKETKAYSIIHTAHTVISTFVHWVISSKQIPLTFHHWILLVIWVMVTICTFLSIIDMINPKSAQLFWTSLPVWFYPLLLDAAVAADALDYESIHATSANPEILGLLLEKARVNNEYLYGKQNYINHKIWYWGLTNWRGYTRSWRCQINSPNLCLEGSCSTLVRLASMQGSRYQEPPRWEQDISSIECNHIAVYEVWKHLLRIPPATSPFTAFAQASEVTVLFDGEFAVVLQM